MNPTTTGMVILLLVVVCMEFVQWKKDVRHKTTMEDVRRQSAELSRNSQTIIQKMKKA